MLILLYPNLNTDKLGKEIVNYLKKTHQVYELDIKLGHDLTNEDFVMNLPADQKGNKSVHDKIWMDAEKMAQQLLDLQ